MTRAFSEKAAGTNARYIVLLPTETGGWVGAEMSLARGSRARAAQVSKETKGYGRRALSRLAAACELLFREAGAHTVRARRGGSPAGVVRRFLSGPSGRQLQTRENRRGACGPHIARAGEERPGGRRAAGARFFGK
jgi:hypothetical protein